MIDYPSFQFASAPRTGTTWFLKACAIAGFGEGHKFAVHKHFVGGGPKIRVSCVRHPVDWLRSYFCEIYPGSVGVPVIDQLTSVYAANFGEFIYGVCRDFPGVIGEIFDSYTADSVFRLEDQPHATVEFFGQLGVDSALTEKCRQMNAQNPGKGWADVTPVMRGRIYEAERDLYERYDYRS